MKPTHTHIDCAVATGLVFAQLLALGANTGFLAALFSELTLVAAGACLLAERGVDAAKQDRAVLGPFLLLTGAMFWASIPLFTRKFGAAQLVPDAAPLELLKLAALGALTLLGAQIGRRPGGVDAAGSWLLGASLLYLLLSLWLWRDNPAAVWGQPKGRHIDRFSATLLNANAAACICAMATLLGLARLHASVAKDAPSRTTENWVEAAVGGLAVLLGVFALLLTASRAGAVALAALALLQALAIRSGDVRSPVPRVLVLAALGGLALAGAVWLGGALTLDRPFTDEDSHVRLAGYRIYAGLIGREPLFGHGLGSFRSLHQSHLSGREADLIWDLGAAHQPVIQAALEGGLPFAVALTAAVAMVAFPAFGSLLRPTRGGETALGLGLSALFILLVAQTDIALNVPAVASLAMLLLGLVWGGSMNSSASAPLPASKSGLG